VRRWRQPALFVGVGTAAAAVHWAVAVAAVEHAGLAPAWANVCGWMVALCVSNVPGSTNVAVTLATPASLMASPTAVTVGGTFNTVTVVVSEYETPNDVRVSVGAVFDPGTGPGVWTIVDAPVRVTWRAIKVNRIDDETVSVREGLKQGDRVVSLGAHVLHEGQRVRVSENDGTQKP